MTSRKLLASAALCAALLPAAAAAAQAPAEPPRDYAAPAGAPYTAREVRIPTPGGWEIAGTLTLPRERRGAVPVVVTLSGSGQQDRDSRLPIVRGYEIFRQVADTLGRRGIGVLRYDDRGVGGSGGPLRDVTTADFADDARAVVAYLRTLPEVDADGIVLLGHSEGGIIAPLVAADDARIAAVVLLAAPSRSGREIVEWQRRYAIEQDSTIPVARRDTALAFARRMGDAALARVPWFQWFLAHDPLPVARRLRQPVLIAQGATDTQVPPEQARELGDAIRAAGNRDVTVRVIAGVNHLFVPDPSGNPAGYTRLADTRVVPALLGMVADWLAARVGR